MDIEGASLRPPAAGASLCLERVLQEGDARLAAEDLRHARRIVELHLDLHDTCIGRDEIVSDVYDKVGDALNDMYDSDLVDTSSAEFSLNGNEIQLDSVDVDKDNISDRVSDVCGDVVRDVLEKYITLSK